MSEVKIDRVVGVLFNAVSEGGNRANLVGCRINANVYCDRNDRFRDGEIISTSPVAEVYPHGLVVTRSGSVYKIASWA